MVGHARGGVRPRVDDARTDARSKVLINMLPVIDNLERAVEHAEKSGEGAGEGAGILDGVKLVLRQFTQAFERCDVKHIDALGAPFDPNIHEAISQMETADYPPGSVAQVYQKGYTIGERLLRASMVVVAKAPPEPVAETPAAGDSDSAPSEDEADESNEMETEV